MDTLKMSYKLLTVAGGSLFFPKLSLILGGTNPTPQFPVTIPMKAQSEGSSEDLPPPTKRLQVGEEESPAGTLGRAIEGFAEEMEKMKQEAKMWEQ